MSFGTCHSCRLPCLVFSGFPCLRVSSVLTWCTDSEDSKMRCLTAILSVTAVTEPCHLNSFEFVSAIACVTSFPFSFSIYVTAHCPHQCPSYTPCDKCKAHQSYQILFCGVMTPSLMPVRPDHCWKILIECVMSCHVMSCHVMSCHVMSCHVMSCHDMT